ncbi:MAG: hypothetical protein CM1200mP40_17990 [Gammaproteobacteria bacterium]|nr:MAG: hypothetical protein CM1200mP40_17990 [Gammaproteobacteria bacterium]
MSQVKSSAQLKKGDEIKTIILSIDPERERISLGVKQLDGDPFMDMCLSFKKAV